MPQSAPTYTMGCDLALRLLPRLMLYCGQASDHHKAVQRQRQGLPLVPPPGVYHALPYALSGARVHDRGDRRAGKTIARCRATAPPRRSENQWLAAAPWAFCGRPGCSKTPRVSWTGGKMSRNERAQAIDKRVGKVSAFPGGTTSEGLVADVARGEIRGLSPTMGIPPGDQLRVVHFFLSEQ